MSDRRRAALPCLALALALACGTVDAQTAREWRQRLDSATAAYARADTAYVRAREAVGFTRNARLVAGGRTVRYASTQLDRTDSARIAEGLERGQATLVRRFGPRGASLIDTGAWFAGNRGSGQGLRNRVEIYTHDDATRALVVLRRPLDPAAVEAFVLQVAGEALPRLAPALRDIGAGSATLEADETRYANAGRSLAVSWSAVGRRCASGALAACRTVLTPVPSAERVERYLGPEDWPRAAKLSPEPPDADSVYVERREACQAGERSACERLLPRLRPPDPFNANLRATVVMHALDLGGADALERLVRSEKTDPIALLADVASVGEDSLIAGWQARTAAAVIAETGSPFPLLLSVFGWSAVALLGATRRRP